MDTQTEKDGRRIQRFSLALPVRVQSGLNENGGWNEITRLTDISAFGAGFNLKRQVKPGRLLQMTMPMPRQMRCYDFAEPQYRVWGLVRTCVTVPASETEENHSVGVAFIGKRPPSSYLNDPAKLFQLTHCEDGKLWSVTDAPDAPEEDIMEKDLRRHSRFSIPTNIIIEKIDAEGNVTASEPTVTENISISGAAVFSTLEMEVGEFVRVKSDQFAVSIISVVRAKRFGQDGIPRLHIEFIDQFFPLEGIE